MADVIDMAAHRKANAPTFEQLVLKCTEEISENWERFARNNRLSDYFIQSTPAWTEDGVDYLSDLNAISLLEKKINLLPTIRVKTGWIAEFEVRDVAVQTPPMFTEQYARCFNILLFLKLGRELTQAGISIN